MTRLPWLLLALVGLPSLARGQEVENLLRRLPEATNAIAIVNVEGAYKSPLGVKENWVKRHNEASQTGTGGFPPSVKLAVLGTQFTPGSGGSWTAGLATTTTNVTTKTLAERERGREETLGSSTVVHSPRNAFFFTLEPRLVGMMHPANRQETSRWLRNAGKPSTQLSPYLVKAAGQIAQGAEIVMAVDLADLGDVHAIRQRLSDATALAGKSVDLDALAKFLAGAQGLTFSVDITDQMKAEVQVDFRDSVRPYNSVVKPLLIEVLGELGVGIEGMKDWTLTTGDTSFKLSYRIHDAELQQVLSLIQLPTPTFASPGETPDAPPAAPPTPLEASQKYYHDVTKLIENLKVLRDKATNHTQNAAWHDQYAKKVDQLPILNVDPDLLSWGSSVANRFRGLSASLRGVSLQANVLNQQKSVYYYEQAPSWGAGGGYGYYGGYYGGAYYQPGSTWSVNNYQQVRAAKVEAAAKGIEERNQVWDGIDGDTAEIRRRMVEKYKVDFSSQATFQRAGQPDK